MDTADARMEQVRRFSRTHQESTPRPMRVALFPKPILQASSRILPLLKFAAQRAPFEELESEPPRTGRSTRQWIPGARVASPRTAASP
jgi:hypothetical protein